ncbi:MAG: TrkH family potassium uptake protein [Thermoleophilaceae bacterium]|nr:TrkH family potassium uptake protein [Thermoleophilaceae bacterium]
MNRLPAGVAPQFNWQLIVPVVSGTLLVVGLGLAACCAVAIASDDGAVVAFGVPAVAVLPTAALGVMSGRRLRAMPLRARDGFFAVAAAWVAAALVGAVPFLLEGTFTRPVDAFFESMSGFTTTGATLLEEIERVPDAVLLWRSMTQWLGGVGIVVLVVAIAPAAGLASQRVFYAETSGVTADRLTPRIADTAKIIWGVYLTLTTAGFLAYWLAGMTPWDALNHIFTTVATGGFSTRTASIAAFDSLAIELVAIVFMAAAGVNFAFYWLALRRRDRLWPQLAEVRAYLLILLGAILVVTLSLLASQEDVGLGGSLRASAFTVVSLMTTTGYTTADFDLWHDFARLGMLVLMFVGACAGSTAGGMKVIRVMLLGKTAAQEVQRQLRPKAVQVLRVRGRVYSEEVRRGVLGFFYLYVAVFVAGTLVMAAIGLDEVTAAASVVATLNVIGPGLGDVGASENYAAVPQGGLWVLSALMLIGRLEVFTILVLLTPAFWRPSVV